MRKHNQSKSVLFPFQRSLDEHAKQLIDCKTKLRTESNALNERKEALQNAILNDTKYVEENENTKTEEMDINELLLPCDKWSEQCMEATAHSTAYHDAILQLDTYLEDEMISMEQYLKQISKLGREQFAKIAIATKVRDLQEQLVSQVKQANNRQNGTNRERKGAVSQESGIICALCGGPAMLRCSRCKNRYYCSTEHQAKDWKTHDKHCRHSGIQNRGFGNQFDRRMSR